MSGGDCRVALDTLGFIVDNLSEGSTLDSEIVAEAMQRQTTFYDKEEDKYNLLSALQKSVRGSDPDAAVHYLARLLDGGADIVMIGRRLMVMASEDIGMAYPSAISVVTACVQAAQMVGLPEAQDQSGSGGGTAGILPEVECVLYEALEQAICRLIRST